MFLQREIMYGGPLRILNDRAMRERAREQLKEMGVNIPSVDVEISKLSGGQRQGIAVARSVYANAKVLLLDEPLAAMGVKESAMILDVIQRLKEKGDVSIVIVAHNYAQIFDFCDRINLLQNGQISFDRRTKDTSVEELTSLVVREYRAARDKVLRPTIPRLGIAPRGDWSVKGILILYHDLNKDGAWGRERAAKRQFDNLYLIVDQQGRWEAKLLPDPMPREFDPLLIAELNGKSGRKYFLIDQFNLTAAEQYLIDEFALN
jgi:energy-coupling factor transporter ATP-binding protein EcfA2